MDQNNINNNSLPNEGGAQEDAQQNKVMGILAYIIFFIPLIAARESKFAMYHANQGLLLFILGILSGIVLNILSSIFFSIFSFGLWGFYSILSTLVYLGIFVLAIIGIINAVNGKMQPLPIIGGFQIIK